MINLILNFLKGGSGKLTMYVILVTSVIGFITWGYNQIYQAGYSARVVEEHTVLQEALEASEKRYKEELEEAKALYSLKTREAQKLSQELEDIKLNPMVIYREIPKIVEASECKFVDPSLVRLLNDSISQGSD
jgi:hypothetical protein